MVPEQTTAFGQHGKYKQSLGLCCELKNSPNASLKVLWAPKYLLINIWNDLLLTMEGKKNQKWHIYSLARPDPLCLSFPTACVSRDPPPISASGHALALALLGCVLIYGFPISQRAGVEPRGPRMHRQAVGAFEGRTPSSGPLLSGMMSWMFL